MVRALLLGMLATTAVAGCGKNDSAPAAQPGAVAGKVLEVSGAVSVAGTPLRVGDPVKTDDSVETGADGNVVIELAHNQARWELGPNHKVKPNESLAWTVATKTGSAAVVDQPTSAAGRPAERSAADTEATTRAAVRGGADQGAPGGVADKPKDAVRTDSPSAPTTPMAQESQPSAAAATTGAPSPTSAHVAAPEKSATRAEEKPSPEPEGGVGGGGGGEDKSKTVARSSVSISPAAQLKTLSSCVPAGSSVHIKAHIASHTATVSFVGEVDDAIQKCIRAAAPKLTMSIDSGDVDLTLTR